MKLRLLKECNGKAAGKVGLFLSEYGQTLIDNGIAELLDEDFIVEQMPQKEVIEPPTVYIPIPVPMSYFGDEGNKKEIIKQTKK